MTHLARLGHIVIAIITRACVLLAFSEFIFFNEGPVIDFLAAGGLIGKAEYLATMVGFYCLSGALLLALEPLMTTLPRAILAGAFVGWSIEAALVPASYENVPFSYFWTAITWHAVIDVTFGWMIWRQVFAAGSTGRQAGVAIALGVFTAVWSTWTWSVVDLDMARFATVMVAITLLLTLGYCADARWPMTVPLGRLGFWLAFGVNLAFWAIWATVLPLPAAGLALVAAITWLLLTWAPAGHSATVGGVDMWRGLWSIVLVMPAAMVVFVALRAWADPVLLGELIVPLVAFGGLIFYFLAAGIAVRQRTRRSRSA